MSKARLPRGAINLPNQKSLVPDSDGLKAFYLLIAKAAAGEIGLPQQPFTIFKRMLRSFLFSDPTKEQTWEGTVSNLAFQLKTLLEKKFFASEQEVELKVENLEGQIETNQTVVVNIAAISQELHTELDRVRKLKKEQDEIESKLRTLESKNVTNQTAEEKAAAKQELQIRLDTIRKSKGENYLRDQVNDDEHFRRDIDRIDQQLMRQGMSVKQNLPYLMRSGGGVTDLKLQEVDASERKTQLGNQQQYRDQIVRIQENLKQIPPEEKERANIVKLNLVKTLKDYAKLIAKSDPPQSIERYEQAIQVFNELPANLQAQNKKILVGIQKKLAFVYKNQAITAANDYTKEPLKMYSDAAKLNFNKAIQVLNAIKPQTKKVKAELIDVYYHFGIYLLRGEKLFKEGMEKIHVANAISKTLPVNFLLFSGKGDQLAIYEKAIKQGIADHILACLKNKKFPEAFEAIREFNSNFPHLKPEHQDISLENIRAIAFELKSNGDSIQDEQKEFKTVTDQYLHALMLLQQIPEKSLTQSDRDMLTELGHKQLNFAVQLRLVARQNLADEVKQGHPNFQAAIQIFQQINPDHIKDKTMFYKNYLSTLNDYAKSCYDHQDYAMARELWGHAIQVFRQWGISPDRSFENYKRSLQFCIDKLAPQASFLFKPQKDEEPGVNPPTIKIDSTVTPGGEPSTTTPKKTS